MFSLIVTIIAITLVAGLTIATLYYGGSSFLEGSTRTAAATLLNQGAQIAGSTMLYSTDQQTVPTRPSDLVAQHYLKELPLPPELAYYVGITPKRSDWEWFSPSTVHVVLRNKINEKTCREVNIKANQTSDIPPIMRPEWIVQCYGLGEPYTFYFDPPGVPQSEREELARTLADPLINVNPDPLDFGTYLVGTQSPSTDILVNNLGGGVLIILNLEFTGDFGGYSDCLAIPMWNGQFCTVTTWFEPTTTGSRTGRIDIENNSIDNPYTVLLSGIGSTEGAPALRVTPNPVQFTDTPKLSTSQPESITITNIGSAPFNLGSPTISGPYTQTHNCPPTLTVSSSCSMELSFHPLGTGPLPGVLTLTGNLDVPVTVLLNGVGVSTAPSEPALFFNPTSLTFSQVKVGQSSPIAEVIMTNSGNLAFVSNAISIDGPYTLTHDCPVSLAPLTSCKLAVTFKPTAIGVVPGKITVAGNTAGPYFVNLTGTGISATISRPLNTYALDFGTTSVGSVVNKSFTFTNQDSYPVTISNMIPSGAPFSLVSDTCSSAIAPGGFCTINMAYSPTAPVSSTGSMEVISDSTSGSDTVVLTGGATTVTGVIESLGTLSHHYIHYIDTNDVPWLNLSPRDYGLPPSGVSYSGNNLYPGIAIGHLPAGIYSYNAATEPGKVTVTYSDPTRNLCGSVTSANAPNGSWGHAPYSSMGQIATPALRDDVLAFQTWCYIDRPPNTGATSLWVYNTGTNSVSLLKGGTYSWSATGTSVPTIWGNTLSDKSAFQIMFSAGAVKIGSWWRPTRHVQNCTFTNPITCSADIISGSYSDANALTVSEYIGTYHPTNQDIRLAPASTGLMVSNTTTHTPSNVLSVPVIAGLPAGASLRWSSSVNPLIREKDGQIYALTYEYFTNDYYFVQVDPTTMTGQIIAGPSEMNKLKTLAPGLVRHTFIGGSGQDFYMMAQKNLGSIAFRIRLP